MPELPEVEILVRQVAPRLRGARIREVEVHDSKLRLPALRGRKILRLWRRGKNIIFDLDDRRHILLHLRMTGWLEFRRPKRYRAAFLTDRGPVYFEDSRRFGVLEICSTKKLRQILERLGPEPFGRFDLHTSRPVKVALLDQKLVAGIGNIYASESLWRAGIHPCRPANRLHLDELKKLRRSVVAALRKGISYGPRIFEVQTFKVYERAGKPCRRCGARIRRIVLAQRSTYFCPRCQRL